MPGHSIGVIIFIMIVVALAVVWSFAWKIVGLWHAARDRKIWWFIAMLFINSLGIIEILYLYHFRDKAHKKFNWRKPFD